MAGFLRVSKNIVACAVLFLLLAPASLALGDGDSGKKAILVPVFSNTSGVNIQGLGESVMELLMSGLSQCPNLSVVERKRLETAASEASLGASGMVDADTAVKLGALVGARYVVLGTIMSATVEKSGFSFVVQTQKLEAAVELTARVVDAQSGVTVGSAKGRGVASRSTTAIPTQDGSSLGAGTTSVAGEDLIREAAQKAVAELTPALVKVFPLEGYVLKYDGKRVLIDLGKGAAEPGMIFTVEHRGAEIIHPVTGKSLGRESTLVGKIKVTETQPQFSYAEVLEKQSDPAPGDVISLVK